MWYSRPVVYQLLWYRDATGPAREAPYETVVTVQFTAPGEAYLSAMRGKMTRAMRDDLAAKLKRMGIDRVTAWRDGKIVVWSE